jgi:hypothetical protein
MLRGSAPPWRCRSSTRWCRRARAGEDRAAAGKVRLDRHRDGARRRRQHRDRPRSTCGRRRRPAATSTSRPTAPQRRSSRTATTSPSSATPTCARPRRSSRRRSAATTSARARCSSRRCIRSRPQGSDVRAGTSLDQLYAQRVGQDTPIPSMQLCIENVDQAGGCAYGYACVYTDTISWASPTPLPMIRDPRVAFDQLFGVGARRRARGAPRAPTRASSTWMLGRVRRLKARSARRPARLDRLPRPTCARSSAASRRSRRATRAASARAARRPDRRARLVRRTRQADVRPAGAGLRGRHHARLLVQDGPRRLGPRLPESGVSTGFHPRRTTAGLAEDRILDFRRSTSTTSSLLPYFSRS